MSKFFDLTPPRFRYLSDSERPFFFEDSRKTLWICIHGGGLAEYRRQTESFHFHRNDPLNPGSINSNTVMCMLEDHNGTLWVGTSVQGGLNKIIARTPYFKSLVPNEQFDDFMENIVRALYQDCNDVVWLATKGGDLKLYSKFFQEVKPSVRNPFEVKVDPPLNIYTIFQDSKGHIWLGAKGGGIAVSRKPLIKGNLNYSSLEFVMYEHDANDPKSLCNNNVYTIGEDRRGNIWIGTFGNGISYTTPTDYANLSFYKYKH
jgi:ligand-binding sensor domain-containing protein